ncbi:hypothetical protein [Microcoleus sp. AR_TQ3_B6]
MVDFHQILLVNPPLQLFDRGVVKNVYFYGLSRSHRPFYSR